MNINRLLFLTKIKSYQSLSLACSFRYAVKFLCLDKMDTYNIKHFTFITNQFSMILILGGEKAGCL